MCVIAFLIGGYLTESTIRVKTISKAGARFGPIGIGWSHETTSPTGQRCASVVGQNPLWYWNYWGNYWQDPYFLWDDLSIFSPSPKEIKHGHTGPVRVGDVVCGWAKEGTSMTVYEPRSIVLSCSTSEDYDKDPCVAPEDES